MADETGATEVMAGLTELAALVARCSEVMESMERRLTRLEECAKGRHTLTSRAGTPAA